MHHLYNTLFKEGFLAVTQEFVGGTPSIPAPISLPSGNTRIQLIDSGILLIEPTRTTLATKAIVLSSGIHGDETAPIEIVDQLAQSILNEQLEVNQRLLLIIGNPFAIEKQTRFDQENMNRLFNGGHQGKTHPEAVRASLLEKNMIDFFMTNPMLERLHYDLHTTIRRSKHTKFAVYPYLHQRSWNKTQIAQLYACGIDTILLSNKPSHTFSYFSSHHFQADAFTLELGQVKPFGENNMDDFSALIDTLQKLISNTAIPLPPFNQLNLNLYQIKAELIKQTPQFRFNFDNDVENFTGFKRGFVLFSDNGDHYLIDADDDAIVFPNPNIPNGQRAGLIVSKTNI